MKLMTFNKLASLKLDSNGIPINTQAVMISIEQYIQSKKGIVISYKIDQALRLFIGKQIKQIKNYDLQENIKDLLKWQVDISFRLIK